MMILVLMQALLSLPSLVATMAEEPVVAALGEPRLAAQRLQAPAVQVLAHAQDQEQNYHLLAADPQERTLAE